MPSPDTSGGSHHTSYNTLNPATTAIRAETGISDDELLTGQQEAILRALRASSNRVLSRTELARAAGLGSSQGRRVDVLLVHIRRTLVDESIVNVRNRGWRLLPSAPRSTPKSDPGESTHANRSERVTA